MSKGTLDAERARAMIKIVNQSAYLAGKLPLEAARLLRSAREQGIAHPALPQGSPARNVLDLQEGMKQFRATLKRVQKEAASRSKPKPTALG
jgi:hypothetical protein